MKTVILAGGQGSRMGKLTEEIPKPMVPIGGKPMLLHIIEYYCKWGIRSFVLCCGYKYSYIRSFFCQFGEAVQELGATAVKVEYQDCSLIIADTGIDTGTAGRVAKIATYIDADFFLTYGDGLSDIDLDALYEKHLEQKNMVTVSAVHPRERFGIMKLGADDRVVAFEEKAPNLDVWINGGFMVMNKNIFTHIKPTDDSLERDFFPRLAEQNLLGAFRHQGFWQCMDTIDEKELLDGLYINGAAPWAARKS